METWETPRGGTPPWRGSFPSATRIFRSRMEHWFFDPDSGRKIRIPYVTILN